MSPETNQVTQFAITISVTTWPTLITVRRWDIVSTLLRQKFHPMSWSKCFYSMLFRPIVPISWERLFCRSMQTRCTSYTFFRFVFQNPGQSWKRLMLGLQVFCILLPVLPVVIVVRSKLLIVSMDGRCSRYVACLFRICITRRHPQNQNMVGFSSDLSISKIHWFFRLHNAWKLSTGSWWILRCPNWFNSIS